MATERGKSPTRLLALISLLVFVFMGVDYLSHGAVRGYVRVFAQPIVTISHSVSHILFGGEFWSSRLSLQEEVRRLTAELEREKGMRAALEVVQSENLLLRSLARVAESEKGVTVPITSSFSSSPYGTFTIGGGSTIGIRLGDVAILGDGFVLGKVTDVSLSSAIVSAVFSPGSVTDVAVGDVAFSLSGRGGGNARADVPRELPLSVGAPVVAPSYANRPVGVIGRVESASSSAFSDVLVLFPYNLNAIQFVHVVPGVEL